MSYAINVSIRPSTEPTITVTNMITAVMLTYEAYRSTVRIFSFS
jgi:hypothetical protein